MENYVNTYFGENLACLREENDMTQLEVSILFGITQQYYSKIECGKIDFSDKILNNICGVFSITPNEFFNYRNTMSKLKVAESEQVDKDLIALLKWRLKMESIHRADLEIEGRKYRTNFIVGDDGPPIHVII